MGRGPTDLPLLVDWWQGLAAPEHKVRAQHGAATLVLATATRVLPPCSYQLPMCLRLIRWLLLLDWREAQPQVLRGTQVVKRMSRLFDALTILYCTEFAILGN